MSDAAGDITAAVAQYREMLGTDNGGIPGSRRAGRREINWDGVPDESAAPAFLPAALDDLRAFGRDVEPACGCARACGSGSC